MQLARRLVFLFSVTPQRAIIDETFWARLDLAGVRFVVFKVLLANVTDKVFSFSSGLKATVPPPTGQLQVASSVPNVYMVHMDLQISCHII